MRTSIVLWSTASGTILGLFADALLIGVGLLLSPLIPAAVGARLHARWLSIATVVVLASIPAGLSVLGYLEGQLKSV
ncbi:MAG: hypothetical protein ABI442_09355 [Gemmatimonadaceae bacterium]